MKIFKNSAVGNIGVEGHGHFLYFATYYDILSGVCLNHLKAST